MVDPLNGSELLEHIIHKLRSELAEHPDFSVAKTHPRFSYQVTINLTTMLSDRPKRVHQVWHGEPVQGDRATTIKVGQSIMTRPGQARAEAGIQGPQRTKLPSGEIADYAPGREPWVRKE